MSNSATVSPQTPGLSSHGQPTTPLISVGDRVVDYRSGHGTVKGIYYTSSGNIAGVTIQYDDGGFHKIVDSKDISPRSEQKEAGKYLVLVCRKGICPGDTVYVVNSRAQQPLFKPLTGTVDSVPTDGYFTIQYAGDSYEHHPREDLELNLCPKKGICVGHTVLVHYQGDLRQGVFTDAFLGKARINAAGGGYITVEINDLENDNALNVLKHKMTRPENRK